MPRFKMLLIVLTIVFSISTPMLSYAEDYVARVYEKINQVVFPIDSARITWYFEGENPVVQYTDENGRCLTTHNPADSCSLRVVVYHPDYNPLIPASGEYIVNCNEQSIFNFNMEPAHDIFSSGAVSVNEAEIKGCKVDISPNPFNPETNINFTLTEAAEVDITVYNALGQSVWSYNPGFLCSGSYSAVFNAANMHSGIYFCRINANGLSAIKKIMLVK